MMLMVTVVILGDRWLTSQTGPYTLCVSVLCAFSTRSKCNIANLKDTLLVL